MDLFREYEVAQDTDETVGKGLDNTEARLELLKREIVAETTIADLERDIRRKFAIKLLNNGSHYLFYEQL